MGRTISIRFTNGRVSKVSGARTPAEMASAAAWGQAFADGAKRPTLEEMNRAAEKLAEPGAPPIEGPKRRTKKRPPEGEGG